MIVGTAYSLLLLAIKGWCINWGLKGYKFVVKSMGSGDGIQKKNLSTTAKVDMEMQSNLNFLIHKWSL